MNPLKYLAAGLLSLAALTPSSAQIFLNDTVTAQNGGGDVSTTIDASGSDMLVVFVVGEHGFNNTSGQCIDITYDGVSLTRLIDRNPIASGTDTLYGDVWYLENPSAVHTAGALFADVTTRGNLAAYALSGTNGIGDSAFSATAVRSVTLNTSADSFVIAAFNMGGAGNTANVTSVTAPASLSGVTRQENGSNWDGHVIGYENGTTAGAQIYEFTGGNEAGAFTVAVEVTAAPPDVDPPTLASSDIVDDQTGGPITDTTTVTYTVTFSEAMDPATIGIDDFENAGSPAATIDSVTGTGAVYTVTVTPGAGNGTLQLQVAASAVLTDTAGNPLDTTTAIADDTIITVTSDLTAPTLAGTDIVDNVSGGPIFETGTVTYAVTFSEAMDPATVEIADFQDGGTSGAVITSVTDSGDSTTFDVVASPAGPGTLILQVAAGAGLTDLAGNALDTAAAIADDTTITVDADAVPTLAGSNIVDNVTGGPVTDPATVVFTVTFSEAINLATIATDDFENAGTAPVTIDSVTDTGDGTSFEVSVTTSGAGSLQLQLAAGAVVEDLTGNPIDTTTAIADDTTITVNPETTPPTLAGTDIVDGVGGADIFETQSVTYTVTFSEDMNASTVEAADFEDAGTSAATIDSVSGSGAVYSVVVSPTGPGTLQLQVKAAAALEDLAGNALDTTSAIADDTTITVQAGSPPPREVVTVDGFTFFNSGSSPVNGTFNASGSDKLVIVVTGEHGFNNTAGQANDITYDGVSLTKLVDRDPVAAGTDTLYHDIWYLDDPGSVHTAGAISANLTTRGNVTVFGLSNTADGAGATAISGSNARSVSITTTTENSIVIASWGIGGAGNTAGLGGIVSDAPLTEVSRGENGSNWDGHVTGYHNVPTASAQTYSWTGGNQNGAVVIAAEFQGAIVEDSDYDTWAALFPAADLTNPVADLDGDGLTNDEERLFGLDPTNPASSNPIAVPLNAGDGTFSFTRRDLTLTGKFSRIETSTDLVMWTEDTGAVLVPGTPDPVTGVETVAVTLSNGLLSAPALFVRVSQDDGILLSENFEDDNGGFTVDTAAGSPWAAGPPTSSSLGGDILSGNGGSANCWGTDIGNPGEYIVSTNTVLSSPAIDLTGVAGAVLTFAEALDLEAADTAEVFLVDDSTGLDIGTAIYTASDIDDSTAPWEAVAAIDLAAGVGSTVRIEWRFTGGTAQYMGWYIDDVTVTETAN